MQVGHVMKKMRTILEAQGYAPDWPALEVRFPDIVLMPSHTDKWTYIEKRCRESEEDAAFVKAHRPKLPNSYRIVRDKVVTNVFCELIVDTLVNNSDGIKDFKYHDSGIGINAEDPTDSDLQTPWGGARTTGTQAEASSKVYQSVAATTYNAGFAIIEHGLFNAGAAGVLMDRTKLGAAINVVDTNQIEWTFTIALTSGG